MRKPRLLNTILPILALTAGLAVSTGAGADPAFDTPPAGAQRGTGPVIYVTGQDMAYDSIVLGPLPFQGPFQKLEAGPTGLQTEFGPGDHGYVGGRWWLDANGDNLMDTGDAYFLCPLLGPAREAS
ncbi:MAG: hypothetical protein OEN55_00495 [Alphaproteobacteria bacterium]|nr:hypothetical protein [Alphaproteobacteria bacterium]